MEGQRIGDVIVNEYPFIAPPPPLSSATKASALPGRIEFGPQLNSKWIRAKIPLCAEWNISTAAIRQRHAVGKCDSAHQRPVRTESVAGTCWPAN